MGLFIAKRLWPRADAPGARLFRTVPEAADVVEVFSSIALLQWSEAIKGQQAVKNPAGGFFVSRPAVMRG